MLEELKGELDKHKNPKRAEHDSRYFKTEPGEYGEGRISFGIKTEIIRDLAKKYAGLPMRGVQELLSSGISDYQSTALRVLIHKFRKADEQDRGDIFNFYIRNIRNINNWDLVDISAPHIVGVFLEDKKKNKLYELAQSKNMWEKRIAIISTFAFIKKDEFVDALRISEILLNDSHDLIHKAIGWMLREIGKRNEKILEDFLKNHYSQIPRTTLRYAIEKFEEDKRKKYLRGEI